MKPGLAEFGGRHELLDVQSRRRLAALRNSRKRANDEDRQRAANDSPRAEKPSGAVQPDVSHLSGFYRADRMGTRLRDRVVAWRMDETRKTGKNGDTICHRLLDDALGSLPVQRRGRAAGTVQAGGAAMRDEVADRTRLSHLPGGPVPCGAALQLELVTGWMWKCFCISASPSCQVPSQSN